MTTVRRALPLAILAYTGVIALVVWRAGHIIRKSEVLLSIVETIKETGYERGSRAKVIVSGRNAIWYCFSHAGAGPHTMRTCSSGNCIV